MLHSVIVGLLLLAIACAIAWLKIYRLLDPANRRAHPGYRYYQVLTAGIALLVIVIALLIVFSSDPGNPDDYLLWP
jgi:divalent metal cation (Fe/Co/Zn/Cd) transporter